MPLLIQWVTAICKKMDFIELCVMWRSAHSVCRKCGIVTATSWKSTLWRLSLVVLDHPVDTTWTQIHFDYPFGHSWLRTSALMICKGDTIRCSEVGLTYLFAPKKTKKNNTRITWYSQQFAYLERHPIQPLSKIWICFILLQFFRLREKFPALRMVCGRPYWRGYILKPNLLIVVSSVAFCVPMQRRYWKATRMNYFDCNLPTRSIGMLSAKFRL